MTEKPSVTLPGIVQKIIKPFDHKALDKAQIAVEGADELYREIRIENKLQTESGHHVALRPGAVVDVTVEASADATVAREPGEGNENGKARRHV